MSMFTNLMGRIFGSGDKSKETKATVLAAAKAAKAAKTAEASQPAEAPETGSAESDAGPESPPSAGQESVAAESVSQPAQPQPQPQPVSQVDVAAKLEEMKAAHREGKNLDWKRSIVDLMKLVGMDSSYGARKELALELGYSQEDIDKKGSAEMNIWLHKQVMTKLAENGGTVPADLLG